MPDEQSKGYLKYLTRLMKSRNDIAGLIIGWERHRILITSTGLRTLRFKLLHPWHNKNKISINLMERRYYIRYTIRLSSAILPRFLTLISPCDRLPPGVSSSAADPASNFLAITYAAIPLFAQSLSKI